MNEGDIINWRGGKCQVFILHSYAGTPTITLKVPKETGACKYYIRTIEKEKLLAEIEQEHK